LLAAVDRRSKYFGCPWIREVVFEAVVDDMIFNCHRLLAKCHLDAKKKNYSSDVIAQEAVRQGF